MTANLESASCAEFAQEVLDFRISHHHREWSNLVNEYHLLCITVARDHSKTSFFSLAYPIWRAARRPDEIGFIWAVTDEIAELRLADIVDEIAHNPKLQWLSPRQCSHFVELVNGHRIYARGFGAQVPCSHPDYVVCDDVEIFWGEEARKKKVEHYHEFIRPLENGAGQVICVGTPVLSDGLYRSLKDNELYEYREYQAIPEKPLWPGRYSAEALQHKKLAIGPVRFDEEFGLSLMRDAHAG